MGAEARFIPAGVPLLELLDGGEANAAQAWGKKQEAGKQRVRALLRRIIPLGRKQRVEWSWRGFSFLVGV